MAVTLTAVADPSNAKVILTAAGGTSGDAFLILRRDSGGVTLVRATSEATVLWPASGSVVVDDYEARQGEGTDYLVADEDGTELAAADRLTVPLWGTWLKSPGRPFLNTRCYLNAEGPVKRPARRVVVPIAGSSTTVALSESRLDARGSLRLATLTAAAAADFRRLTADGAVLMLDTDPAWASPYRYVSIGDVDEERIHEEGLGLSESARMFVLSEVVNVPAPLGTALTDETRTYDQLATLYGSYAGLAATVDTYEDLVL